MVIDHGVAKIGKGESGKLAHHIIGVRGACLKLLKKLPKPFFVHGKTLPLKSAHLAGK